MALMSATTFSFANVFLRVALIWVRKMRINRSNGTENAGIADGVELVSDVARSPR
jgi:hypothetical protein